MDFIISILVVMKSLTIDLWYLWIIFLLPVIFSLIKLFLTYIHYYIVYLKSDYRENSFFKTFILKDAKAIGAVGEFMIYKNFSEFEDGKVLSNIYIKKEDNLTCEIDIIFIHPTGLYVIESKNLSGYIRGDEKYPKWFQHINRKRYEFINPIRQNNKHIEILKNHFENRISDECFMNVVIFSERCKIGKINYNRNKAIALKRENQIKVFTNLLKERPVVFNSIQLEYLYKDLYNHAHQTSLVKEQHIENITKKEGII